MIDGKMYPTFGTLFVQNQQIKTYQNLFDNKQMRRSNNCTQQAIYLQKHTFAQPNNCSKKIIMQNES
jgi:hypothetical protein